MSEFERDEEDAKHISSGEGWYRPRHPVTTVRASSDDDRYPMNHGKRGKVVIFNHMNFDRHLRLNVRNGTNADVENLKECWRISGYDDITVFKDLQLEEIRTELTKLQDANHTDCDSLVIVVLTHGKEGGVLYASDKKYDFDILWQGFTSSRCPTLAGKPKMFFVQACRGDKLQDSVEVQVVSTDGLGSSSSSTRSLETYKIPTHADFLFGHSTIPGYFSWRSCAAGSWYIQALHEVLMENASRTADQKKDLLSMLTVVNRLVGFHFESNPGIGTPAEFRGKKQIPSITSHLTRDVYF